MERKDLVGKSALVFYQDNSNLIQAFGVIKAFDDTFLTIQTSKNTLLIPNSQIQKIKLRGLERD
ncbi:MAG: hypothetical protein ABIE23_05455 [archaeon]